MKKIVSLILVITGITLFGCLENDEPIPLKGNTISVSQNNSARSSQNIGNATQVVDSTSTGPNTSVGNPIPILTTNDGNPPIKIINSNVGSPSIQIIQSN